MTGALGRPVRFRARLSSALPWTVTITDAAGADACDRQRLRRRRSTGRGIRPVWRSPASRWRIGAGTTVTAAAGSLGSPGTGGAGTPTVGLAITGAAADPETISPNADGASDATTLIYTTTAVATVDVTLLDAAGVVLAQLLAPTRSAAGEHTLIFDGLGLPDGVYTMVVTAIGERRRPGDEPRHRPHHPHARAGDGRPRPVRPGAAGRPARLDVGFQLSAPATVRVRILRDGKWVATPFSGTLPQGVQLVGWDGAKRVGRALDGSYTAVVEATDTVGTASIALPFLKDATPPRLRVLAGKTPRLWVSEPAVLTVRVNGALRRLEAPSAGPVSLPGIRKLRTLVAVARDAAGNRTVLRLGL